MTRPRFAMRSALCATLLAGLLAAPCAFAQVTLNFVNADIDQVAKAIGAATGRTIIVDPRVKGQLNLVSEQAVPQDQALKIMQSALRMQGFALVLDHGVLKVVPEADAKLQGVPTYVGNQPQANGDQIITQVFQLKNESANNLLPVLRPLISPNNTIAAYPANNTLVVTDYADNVRRIASIIAGVDNGVGQEADVVQLKNANSVDLAASLTKILDPSGIGATDATLKVTVIADPRTNSLLLRATNRARLESAKSLIKKMDSPTAEPGNIHVVPLRNASAVTLARTLHNMMGQGGQGGSSSDSNNGLSGTNNNNSNSGGLGNSSGTGTSGTPPLPSGSSGSLFGSSGSNGSNPMGGSGSGQGGLSSNKSDSDDSSGGMITADAATNSLIITAPESTYRNLRNVIDQLDARRAQVYIESLIIEVNSDKAGQFGVQWQGGLSSSNGNNAVIAGTNFNSSTNGTSNGILNLTAAGLAGTSSNTTTSTALAGLASTTVNDGLNIGILHRFGSILGLGGLLQALSTNNDVNVLSTPNLITLDNEEAKIVVGQNVPIISGSYSTSTISTTGNVGAFNTYTRQDVGITLDVKPQISEGGIIKLLIYQEDSSVVAGTAAAQGGVTINKRALQSTVLTDNGQIIVLGGLIQDSYANGNSKIPLLGNLPLIGSLFRTENKDRSKTNLMVFLRPVIVRDADTSQRISLDRYDYMRAESGNYQSDNRLIKDKVPPQIPAATVPVPGTPAPVGVFAPPQPGLPAKPGMVQSFPDGSQIVPGAANQTTPTGSSGAFVPDLPADASASNGGGMNAAQTNSSTPAASGNPPLTYGVAQVPGTRPVYSVPGKP